jgi:hypothetical protein
MVRLVSMVDSKVSLAKRRCAQVASPPMSPSDSKWLETTWIEALKAALRTAAQPTQALRVPTEQLTALVGRLEKLEEENRLLRAAASFGTDAA